MAIDTTRLQQLEASDDLIDFAAGIAIQSLRPCQAFLAPVVPVYSQTGRFKQFTKDSRLVIPSTRRALGNEAVELGLNLNTQNYECDIHAANVTLDTMFGNNLDEYLIADAMTFLSDVRSQVMENEVITLAFKAAGAGTPAVFSSAEYDPVKLIDAQILTLMRTAKTGDVAVLFDPLAWDLFKNNPRVLEHSKGMLSWDQNPSLFHGNAEYRQCYSIYDENPPGAAENIQFQLPANTVLIFARSANVTRSDPSWIKTFLFTQVDPKKKFKTLDAPPKLFRLVPSPDGRRIIVRLDFSVDIQVTNTLGALRLNIG